MAIIGTVFTAREYRDAGQRALARQTAANRVFVDLLDAQTSNRGYTLTGRGSYLQPYTQAVDRYPDDMARLRRLVSGDPELERSADAIDEAAQLYLEEAVSLIRLRRQDQTEAAIARVIEGRDEERFSQFRVSYAALLDQIEQSRQRTSDRLDRRALLTVVAIVVAAVLALIMVVVASRQLWSRVGGPIGLVTAGVRRVASGDLTQPVPTTPVAVSELAELADGFNTMQREVQDQRTVAAAAARRAEAQRVERQLWDTVQRGLLPDRLPWSPGLRLAARYQPAERSLLVGGDLYDAVALADGRMALMVGDISGHGATTAAQAAGLRFGWRTLVSVNPNPPAVIAALNAQMADPRRRAEGMFASMIYALVDQAGRVSFASAGHPAPFMLTAAGCQQLRPSVSGPLLGVFDDAQWPVTHGRIPPGGTFVLFSDGLVEARRGSETFGATRACEVLERERRSALEARLERLVDAARRHEDAALRDDVVVLGAERPMAPRW